MKKLLIVAVLFAVGTLVYWGLDWIRFQGTLDGICQRVDLMEHQLGQKLAREGLRLSRPYMETEYNGHRMSKMDQWGRLSERADRVYDTLRPWKERESPSQLVTEVLQEFGFGVFHKNHPDTQALSGYDAFKEAKKNPGWAWLLEGDGLLGELKCFDWEANRARDKASGKLQNSRQSLIDLDSAAAAKLVPPPKIKKGMLFSFTKRIPL